MFRANSYSRRLRLGTFSGAAAVLLSIVLAGTAMAASWSTPAQLSSSGNSSSVDVVTLNSRTAVAAYSESNEQGEPEGLFVRRSNDGGVTWGPPVMVSAKGNFPALAANGMNVDLVFNSGSGRVRYARSTDGGVTFAPSMPLSPRGRFAWRPDVGHGPGGVVVVVYEDVQNGNVVARVSTNNGASFAAADILTTNGEEVGVAAAVGDGVIYVGYSVGSDRLRLRRSFNNGATWTAQTRITNNNIGFGISLAAVGSHAYFAFTGPNDFPKHEQAVMRRTTNSGGGWSSLIGIAPRNWTTQDPDLGLSGGVLHAGFSRCPTEFDTCFVDEVYYRRSTTGTSWNNLLRASPGSVPAFGPSVGSHRPLIVYTGENSGGLDVFARTRVPD